MARRRIRGAAGQGEARISEANRFLAYEHSIYLQAEEDKVVPVFEAVSGVPRGGRGILRNPGSARFEWRWRVRIGEIPGKAGGIRKLIAILSAQGEVASQSTSAEDLAGPIADTAKQIAMLTDYRTSLEALRSRPSNDLDALMKLTRELADVQSQIETLTGNQAGLISACRPSC